MNGYILLGLLVVLAASIESRKINGDFRDSYNFEDANGNPFIATYSADNESFHQEDNTPEPPTHSRAKQAERDDHFQRWEELAGFKNPGDDIYNKDLVRAEPKKQYYQEQLKEWKYQPTEEEKGGTGFHQVDNTPKVELKTPTFSRAVQAGRDDHFQKWEAAAGFPNPHDDIYNRDLVRS